MNSSTTTLRIARNHASTATLSLMSASASAMLTGASLIAIELSQTVGNIVLQHAASACIAGGVLFACASVIASGIASRNAAQRAIHLAAIGLGSLTLVANLFAATVV